MSLRGGRRPTWALSAKREEVPWGAISGGQLRFCRKYPVIQPGPAEIPRRFAPRNDKSGGIARSTMSLHNLPACKALAARKGHAASVRRQSRQWLRSERRYRRNRFYHCNDSLFLAPVRRREGHARPLQRAIDTPYHKPYPSKKIPAAPAGPALDADLQQGAVGFEHAEARAGAARKITLPQPRGQHIRVSSSR